MSGPAAVVANNCAAGPDRAALAGGGWRRSRVGGVEQGGAEEEDKGGLCGGRGDDGKWGGEGRWRRGMERLGVGHSHPVGDGEIGGGGDERHAAV